MTRIGPAGWAYKDWAGVVYPARRGRGFSELAYLARYFDTIEINVSFYRPITSKTGSAWLEKIQDRANFRFTAKLWRGFTHDRNATSLDEQAFKDGFAPLLEAARLGALLLQFPWSFRNTAENRGYLAKLCEQFAEFPLVLEVRHASWCEPGVLEFLERLNVGLCNIDQPLFKKSVGPSALTTSPLGYVRLHGRNYQSWFRANKYAGERYDYLYSAAELAPWAERIQTVANATQDTYVVTNNHYLGKAIVNAFEISSILNNAPLPIPPELLERYPELREIAVEEPGQLPLL